MECDECLDGWSGGGCRVFIAPNHQNNRWGWLLSMGVPDSPVRQPRHPTVRVLTQPTVGALTSTSTGQSGAAPDRHCSLSGAPLTSALTSAANYSSVKGTVQSTVALESRCSASASDSPVNYSGVTPEKPE
jgi:tRNA A37 threonylcarbamoyladenosine synthetase subunit TsaC/SUA5/YrdC